MHWLAALIIIIQITTPALLGARIQASTAGQVPVEINDQTVEYEFGQEINFSAQIAIGEAQVSEMLVFITPEGQATVWEEMDVDQDGLATQSVDARRLPLFPFSRVEYRFEARLDDGSALSSETFWFDYEDNRFNWHSSENGIFQVFWYGFDITLGQEILNIAQSGLQKAQTVLAVSPPEPLRIYAYTSSRDLQSALQLSGQSWVAGHATPELGMILISVPSGPEKKLELERQIPHEILHLLQYQIIGSDFPNQPIWLIEGMASLAELYPNPEYRRVLESTAASDNLIPFSELCASFPREAHNAFRAYAQSESFTRFLHEKYGNEKLRQLMDQYHSGLGCEEGVAAVYGVSLSQMEYRWKQEALGIDTGQLAMQNLSPYLLLGFLVIIPAALGLLPLRSRKKNQ
jgi:hypothetical protein